MHLFPLGERERYLSYAILEIEFQGNEREPLPLDRADQTTDFLAVEQQLARSRRFVVRVSAALVCLNVGVEQEHFAVTDDAVGIRNVRLAAAQRLDLGPAQNQAGLERLEDVIIEARALVLRDAHDVFFLLRRMLQSAALR